MALPQARVTANAIEHEIHHPLAQAAAAAVAHAWCSTVGHLHKGMFGSEAVPIGLMRCLGIVQPRYGVRVAVAGGKAALQTYEEGG